MILKIIIFFTNKFYKSFFLIFVNVEKLRTASFKIYNEIYSQTLMFWLVWQFNPCIKPRKRTKVFHNFPISQFYPNWTKLFCRSDFFHGLTKTELVRPSCLTILFYFRWVDVHTYIPNIVHTCIPNVKFFYSDSESIST